MEEVEGNLQCVIEARERESKATDGQGQELAVGEVDGVEGKIETMATERVQEMKK